MRFIPALFLILSFQCAYAIDEYQVTDYKCWLFTGVVAASLQVAPQVVEIVYAHVLGDELHASPHNATTPYVALFSTTSAISNGVGILASIPLIYNAQKGVISDTTTSTQHCRRRTMEVAFAIKSLMSLGMQTAASYLTFNIYNAFNGAPGTPDALLPTLISGMVSLGVAILPLMGGIALIVKSSCFARHGYMELPETA